MKLTDERVRELLAYHSDDLARMQEPDFAGIWSTNVDPGDVATLSQQVIDLRTANALLESALAEMGAELAHAKHIVDRQDSELRDYEHTCKRLSESTPLGKASR